MTCRHCAAPLNFVLIDLGSQPASNAYLTSAQLAQSEVHAPLKVFVCTNCWLVQLPEHHSSAELFTPDYAYFSSVSKSWVAHAERYATAMIDRFALGASDWVVEVASNDGYLLQFFADAGIACTGIEPTASTASAARARGIESLERFFSRDFADELVAERGHARLIAANNVLAHVPDINDFVAGFARLLAADGVATFEFPELRNLIAKSQFDTIYHEHYSYLSLIAVKRILGSAGLRVFDVEFLGTHGGSLRVFACHDTASHVTTDAVAQAIEREVAAGLADEQGYSALAEQAFAIKLDLVEFLVAQKRAGARVAAYGAAAKGNTLLNYAGVHADLIDFVCDAAPSKQGQYMPGSHIPILPPAALSEHRPDIVLILPWNLKDEIVADHDYIREWGGRFVTCIPTLEVF